MCDTCYYCSDDADTMYHLDMGDDITNIPLCKLHAKVVRRALGQNNIDKLSKEMDK